MAERRGADLVTIATVAQSSLIAEIAERLAEPPLGAAQRTRWLVVVLPLKPGAREEVRALLDERPPFDPEPIEGLVRHEAFLTPDEVVFLFESDLGTDWLATVLSQPKVSQAAAAWHEHIDGPPRIAEGVFSWSRPDDDADEDVFYLPTPGPGDSDGGDVY